MASSHAPLTCSSASVGCRRGCQLRLLADNREDEDDGEVITSVVQASRLDEEDEGDVEVVSIVAGAGSPCISLLCLSVGWKGTPSTEGMGLYIGRG